MRASCLVLTSRRSRDRNPGFSAADDAAAWSVVFVFIQINTFVYLRKMAMYQTNSVYVKLVHDDVSDIYDLKSVSRGFFVFPLLINQLQLEPDCPLYFQHQYAVHTMEHESPPTIKKEYRRCFIANRKIKAGRDLELWAKSVSYTHLTLPTNVQV